jgi:flavin reductase (DIM6/NTAB) family NADH-FMN oxidoreductase RutF
MKKSYPLSKVYGLLEPGPVVLVTTAQKGRANVMTLSWLTMMDFEPPLIGMVLSDRNFSFAALKATKQCVINIPTVELGKKVVAVGNCSGRRLDKFAAFGLTPRPAKRVASPLIDECYASLECRVTDAHLASKYNFFVLEVLKAWIDPARKRPRTLHHLGKGRFVVDGRTITLPSRMK